MIARVRRAASALLDTVEFWITYLFFLLACALEPDEQDSFDLWERP